MPCCRAASLLSVGASGTPNAPIKGEATKLITDETTLPTALTTPVIMLPTALTTLLTALTMNDML